MKTCSWLVAAILSATLVVGCSKKSSVDTTPIETSFKSAEPATQSTADKAVASIKSEDYAGALVQLQTLAKDAKLTPEQQQAIKDVMAQVQKMLTDTAAKGAADVNKAAGDLQKSLPK